MTTPPPSSDAASGGTTDPRPVVALPRAGMPGFVIAVGAAIAALALFLALDAHRRAAATAASRPVGQDALIASPPPLAVPPEIASTPPLVVSQALAPPPSAQPLRTPSYAYPPVVASPAPLILPVAPFTSNPTPVPNAPVSESAVGPAYAPPSSALIIDGAASGDGRLDAMARSSASQGTIGSSGGNRGGSGIGGDDTPARATPIGDRTTIMPVGTVIPAVLETPIDTARPGLVRAIVSRDTRGFDGRRVLVPRGSRLIGEYQADVRSGQNRVLVTWNRLIRPDGVSVRLVSPTADPLGSAGVPGHVNTFFWQRFASALLQSALTIGVNLASRPRNGSVIIGLPTSGVTNVVGQALAPGNDLRPKITVKHGAALTVFVARDLDFASTSDRP